ncbi:MULTISPECIES: WhiB family transcriptional regulator [unclassified Streptomyces]|uniref:WhiB family transcriptional regulator n=1 Tax=Streptomyces sp. NBC_00060 TaxID=2975636 RepID=A0AAU2GTE3_9ACTN
MRGIRCSVPFGAETAHSKKGCYGVLDFVPADPRVPFPDAVDVTACSEHPAWFSDRRQGEAPEELERAKETCRTCPVARQCLLWALANPALTTVGVWAGTTPKERALLRARLEQRLGPDWISAAARRRGRGRRHP